METMLTNDLYGSYRNKTFCEIYPVFSILQEEYDDSPLKTIDNEHLELLYYLLYAKHGNDPIANADENQFKYRLFSIIFSHGPTWVTRVELQKQIRELPLEELMVGGKAVYNRALNPSSAPSMQALEELTYINEQNTTNYKKSKIEAIALQLDMLDTSITEDFVNKFSKLFNPFVSPELPLLYEEN